MGALRGRVTTRAPLVVGALFAVPVFFMALLVSSLALDTPTVEGRKLGPTASGTEAKVWAVALIAPAVMVGIGALGLLLGRYGVFIPIAGAVVACFLLPYLAGDYIGRHERRFPYGMDFIRDNAAGNASSRGDWEHAAKATVVSMSHWTLVLAALALVGTLIVLLRRPEPVTPGLAPDPVVGAPEVSPGPTDVDLGL